MSAARQWPGVAPVVGFFALAFGLSWGVGAVFKRVPIVSPDGLFIGGVSLAAIIVLAVTVSGSKTRATAAELRF